MIGADLPNVQVWLATTPVDMRKSFDSLAELVRLFLSHDPLSGNLFVFRNNALERLKILWWDEGGLAIYYKRLEHGEFQFPRANTPSVQIGREELVRLFSGLSIVTRKQA